MLICDDCGNESECVMSTGEWLDELGDELNLTEMEKCIIRENDDGYERCESCFRKWIGAKIREN